MTFQLPRKSTTVRTKRAAVRIKIAVLRALFTVAEPTLPGSAARLAERLWFRCPPTRVVAALPPGENFSVRSQGILVRGRRWGAGPTVYLVHGWGGTSAQLGSLVAPLVSAHFRVVAFDAPGHGRSEAGAGGPGTGHAVEFGQALDEVAARFGPAHAVVAHSMGSIATLLAVKHGWLGSERLVFLAPMDTLARYLDEFAQQLHIGPRVLDRLHRRILVRVGYPVSEFDLAKLATEVPRPPLLIVHDRGDRDVPFGFVERLVEVWPGATLQATEGLGHRRILSDPGVIASAVQFVRAADSTDAAGADSSAADAQDRSGQASIAAASSW